MATSKSGSIDEGDIYAIPLFVSDTPSDVRFRKVDLVGDDKEFVFGRVISNRDGVLLEIFDVVGDLETPVSKIENGKRLLPPIAVSTLPIKKRRWVKVGRTDGFDREKHANYSEIRLLLGTPDHRILWQGGKQRPANKREIATTEEWIVWRAHSLERRILEALGR